MHNSSAKAIAHQKFRDADSWRLAFEISAHRYQHWMLLWLMRRCAFKRCFGCVPTARLIHLSALIDEAHDLALSELDNMRAAARNAAAAELAGRIYDEEHQEGWP